MSNIEQYQSQDTAPATTHDRGIHRAGEFTKYTPDQREQLRALGGFDEASDGDLDMLAAFSDRTGLDPFVKEVYLVGRKTKTGGYRGEPERWETKWTVQTGIDGFRKVTHRVGEQKAQPVKIGRPIFYDSDGNQRPFWSKKWGHPEAVEVTVSIGESEGVGVATWDEYVQTKRDGSPNQMWDKMGPTMLAKCAEAQAHRRVTPLTSGMYVAEEMMQADNTVRATATRQDARGMDAVRQALAERKQAPAPKEDPTAGFIDQITNTQTVSELGELMGSLQTQVDEQTWQALTEAADKQATTLQEEQ